MDTKISVVYIFFDSTNNCLLVETRPKSQFLSGEKIFPAGKVKKDEIHKIENCLLREISEELDVKPLDFIDFKVEIKGLGGYMLRPFLITSWEGSIPDNVLDSGAKLSWVHIDEYKPKLNPVQKILKLVKEYVAQS